MRQFEQKFSLLQNVFSSWISNVDIRIQSLTSEISYPNFKLLFCSKFEFELFNSWRDHHHLGYNFDFLVAANMIFHVIIKRHNPFRMQWLHNAYPDVNLYFMCLFAFLQLLFDFERTPGLSFLS